MEPTSLTCPIPHQRRQLIQAILSPSLPGAPLEELIHFACGKEFSPAVDLRTGNVMITCSLCQCQQLLTTAGVQNPLLKATLKEVMTKVGLDLKEDDLNFCSFCSSHLQHLLRLKMEMDRLGDHLGGMVVGLHGIFIMTSSPPSALEEAPSVVPSEVPHPSSIEEVLNDSQESPTMHSLLQPEHLQLRASRSPDDEGPVVEDVTKGRKRPFPCHICPLSFIERRHLTIHLNRHLPQHERPFMCHICSRRFADSFTLKCHSNTHLPPEERPYKCSFCDKRFSSPWSLKSHTKTIHNAK